MLEKNSRVLDTSKMTFKKLHEGISCDCLSGAKEDIASFFARRIKGSKVSEKDILTHQERGIKPKENDCSSICSKRGLSINICLPDNEDQIEEKYRTTFNFSPKKGMFYIKFRIKPSFALVKDASTPNDPSHRNLFKADCFDINAIEVVETRKVA